VVCFDLSCKEAAKQIFQVLKVDNSKRFSLVVHLIEACSKNGNLMFHKCISTDAFVDVLLASLKRVRGKHKVIKKLETKSVSLRWESSESRLLGLIQVWADTFMMKEDEFPGFQKMYR
jgi:lipoate-protein ligase A